MKLTIFTRSQDKKPSELLKSVLLITSFFIMAFYFYAEFDPNEMLEAGIFPWDSSAYRAMAEQISSSGFSELNGNYPFAPRLLFPILCSVIEGSSKLSYIESAYLINAVSSLLVALFTFFFLLRNAVLPKIAFAITATYILFWLGPLRYTQYFPGGTFAFDSLLICSLFYILERASTRHMLSMIAGMFVVFFLAIGREVVFYLLAISLASALILKLLLRYALIREDKIIFNTPHLSSLLLLFLSSFSGFIAARILINNTSEGYSTLFNIFEYAWFHAHAFEFLYPLFYALGPLFLCFILALTLPNARLKFLDNFLHQTKHPFFLMIFVSSGILFAMTGGTDSDRFLVWFFPFFALIGAYAFSGIWMSLHKHKRIFAILLILVTACWSRFYVPAIPHVFFPGELYNSYAGVRSDLSPKFFYGPKALEKFRLPLKEVPFADTHVSVVIDNPQALSDYQPNISSSISRQGIQSESTNPFLGSYAYEINNIPFPLGFAHNQFELFVIHPHYGSTPFRALLLVQWLFLLAAFYLLCRRGARH